MERFLERYNDRIVGTIAGFDRILFRGQILHLCHPDGMGKFLSSQKVLYKDFSPFAQTLTNEIKAHAQRMAEEQQRPYEYLTSAAISKEEKARAIIERDQLSEGLVCVLSCLEPCYSYHVRGDRASKQLRLVWEPSKCQHFYFYYLDRDFGLMHVRLQAWFPFTIQICVNGREWLARQLSRAGIAYTKVGNCLTEIADLKRAQALFDSFNDLNFAGVLGAFARRVNPWLGPRGGKLVLLPYYWTMRQAEYATDLMFCDRQSLCQIYPALVNHAITQFSCQDVMRFLGRRTNTRFSGTSQSSYAQRVEGIRVKHWVEENSIKMYDKAGSVLRVETTINNPKRFRAWRTIKTEAGVKRKSLPLRKGVADIGRRVEISRAANGRYLEALAVVGLPTASYQLLDQVSDRVRVKERKYRALHPITAPESEVFQVVLRGEHQLQGVRNQDLRKHLYPEQEKDEESRHRSSARVSRQLGLLKAHGLVYKVPKTNYYRVTKKGHQVMATAIKFRDRQVALLAA